VAQAATVPNVMETCATDDREKHVKVLTLLALLAQKRTMQTPEELRSGAAPQVSVFFCLLCEGKKNTDT
jgi:hypothetical protein